jgi:hypothetical protein
LYQTLYPQHALRFGSWTPKQNVVIAVVPQKDRPVFPVKRHAVRPIDACFEDARMALHLLRPQGWMTPVLTETPHALEDGPLHLGRLLGKPTAERWPNRDRS